LQAPADLEFERRFNEVLGIAGAVLPDDNRREEGRATFATTEPLIGWLGEMRALFAYYPMDLSPNGMRLRVVDTSGERIIPGENLDLCLPFRQEDQFLSHGEVRWEEPIGDDRLCGVRLFHGMPRDYKVFFDTGERPVETAKTEPADWWNKLREFLQWVIEDTGFVKRTLVLYLNHLTPLLARLAGVDRSVLELLKRGSLGAMETKILANIESLQELGNRLPAPKAPIAEWREFLVEFRRAIQPEIDTHSLSTLAASPETARYLQSIRLSERKLAMHYNSAVLLVAGVARLEA